MSILLKDMMSEFVWNEKTPPLVLVGPTAVGKTEAAIRLAERIGAEIISADSQQVYRRLDIGTAKPTPQEKGRAAFHLCDFLEPAEQYNAAFWKRDAEGVLFDLWSREKTAVICGGTGMFVKALLENWSLTETPAIPELRETLRCELAERGAKALHAELVEVDPLTAEKIHPNDPVRIVRALEVYRGTGQPLSERRDAKNRRAAVQIGLTMDRAVLYRKIDRRVETMFARGWVDETAFLRDSGLSDTSPGLKCLGYKEICAFLRGETTLAQTVETVQRNTRRYAKRQWTWFHADPTVHWINITHLNSAEATERILAVLRETPLFSRLFTGKEYRGHE